MAKSKNKRVSITVNERELNGLEEFVICYNVCQKHKGLETEEQFDEALRTCPNCKRKWKRKWNCARDITCKLWRAYENSMLETTRNAVKKAGITPKDLEVAITKVRSKNGKRHKNEN